MCEWHKHGAAIGRSKDNRRGGGETLERRGGGREDLCRQRVGCTGGPVNTPRLFAQAARLVRVRVRR